MTSSRTLMALVLLVACPLLASPAADPRAQVQTAYDRIQTIVQSTPDEAVMRDKVKALTLEFVDFDEFSRQTLKATWETLNSTQKAEFVSWFKRLIQATYARHFKAKQDLKIAWRGDTAYAEDKAQVASTVSFEKTAVDVDYRFFQHADGGWWVYDIVIDEVSLARNYRGQFVRIVQKDGFDVLMGKIKAAVERKEKGADATDQL